MKLTEIAKTATFAWSADVVPLLAAGLAAGAVDLDFLAQPTLEIWDALALGRPLVSLAADSKLHALAWSRPFGTHTRGVLVAAYETGALEFYDVARLLSTQLLGDSRVHTLRQHTGAARSLAFSPLQPHVLALGGTRGELYVWDLATWADPVVPGRAMTPMDEVLCVAWNNAVPHILASTSNDGYTSIWDLKLKREVLHLRYSGALGKADFSHVAWHPSQLTKLATASQNDACPLVMTWDLRNAAEPEHILHGHTKGVLSIDWCPQDPALLLLSGKDNSTRLWNPLTGARLGEYPPAANWTFLARFAPRAPDIFAAASFDGRIVVQTLQDTSPPALQPVEAASDDDFWSTIGATKSLLALFEVLQAPQWLKRPCAVLFGFGLKVVLVRNAHGAHSVLISKLVTDTGADDFALLLAAALKLDDFSAIIAAKADAAAADAPDWEVLQKLQKNGKDHFILAIVDGSQVRLDSADDEPKDEKDDFLNDDSFFDNLSNDLKSQKATATPAFVPSGNFTILDGSQSPADARLANLLLGNKIKDAVSACLEEGKLLEALVLALDLDADVKDQVKNSYFAQNKSQNLSRLIYSASSGDVLDIVTNADIANWKEIASSISAYCKDENEFNSRVVKLGDRILESGSSSKEDRNNALMCYLAGNALDKVSAIWLKDLPSLEQELLHSGDAKITSPFAARYSALGSFAEKLSAYRSISKISGPLSGPSIEPVCKAIWDFSNMAASGGHFELADQYMALLPEDFAGLKSEKERIAKATGTKQEAPKDLFGRRANGSAGLSNGSAKPHGRYTRPSLSGSATPVGQPAVLAQNSRFAQPSLPRVPQVQPPIGHGAPVAPPPSNPYVPNATSANPVSSFNPYTPNKSDIPVGVPPIQRGAVPTSPRKSPGPALSLAPTGSVRPPATPTMIQNFGAGQPNVSNYAPAGRASVVSPPTAPPSKPRYKEETEGWNDLPETFKNKAPARRTPAPSAAVVPASPLIAATVPAPSQPPKRTQAQAVPPPPKVGSRVPSKTTAPDTPKLASSPRQVSNKYAPPPSAVATQNANGPHSGMSSPVVSTHPNKSSAPPKNPYAPPPVSGPAKVSSYAPPPSNNFASPQQPPVSRAVSSMQLTNPYTPPAGVNSPMGTVPPPSRSFSYQQPSSLPSPLTLSFPPPPPSSRPTPAAYQQPPAEVPPPPVKAAAPPKAPVASAPPVNNSAPPVSQQKYAAPPPVSAPSVPAPPPKSAQPAGPVQGGNGPSAITAGIRDTFSTLVATIKPAAPPKYAKHVADMEKRLNILFGHLDKQSGLSGETVGLLHKVADALNAKDFAAASTANQEISDKHSSEAGDWHTGVKRLVTMAEAFDS